MEEHVELYVLKEWDGADGFSNYPIGLVTKCDVLADHWKMSGTGRSYDKIEGKMVHSFLEIAENLVENEKEAALAKLTFYERELLGLN